MSEQPDQRVPDSEAGDEQIDIDELTAAVERLLRRDLEIARERLRGSRGNGRL